MSGLTHEEKIWYWLASTPRLGFKHMVSILEMQISLEEIFADPGSLSMLPEGMRETLKGRADMGRIEEELFSLEKQGIHAVPMPSGEYPPLLREIYRPPLILYVKGSLLRVGELPLGMVGTRLASREGLARMKQIARELADAGVTVVSGMARGIDTACHKGALEAGGVTVAVLGCGVERAYPSENKRLYHAIAETGAVISEFPPGTPPFAGNFPVRNRIISGMSRGILVGEANEASGAHNTARHAYEENRDVFAVPAEKPEQTAELPALLMENGSLSARSAREVLSYYGWAAEEPLQEESPEPGLDFFERELYNLLLKGDMTMQQLADRSGSAAAKVSLTLTKLEVKGLVERLPGNRFGKKI